MLIQRISRYFGSETAYDEVTFRQNVLSVAATIGDVEPYLIAPEDKPYGRRLIYSNEQLEVLVMHWSPGLQCLPHDHGSSVGWVHVVSGAVEHTLCHMGGDGTPEPQHSTIEQANSILFAPLGMVHMMCAVKDAEPTVTIHFYSPPISGMRVFDLDTGAACVVADDCGAWWPLPEQMVSLLPPPRSANPLTANAQVRLAILG